MNGANVRRAIERLAPGRACAAQRRSPDYSPCSLAPRSRRLRTACRATDERHGEFFLDQDRANVVTVGFQRPAISPIVAEARTLCARRARASDIHEVEMTGPDKIEKALRGPDS